jgi:hypothetical protein
MYRNAIVVANCGAGAWTKFVRRTALKTQRGFRDFPNNALTAAVSPSAGIRGGIKAERRCRRPIGLRRVN